MKLITVILLSSKNLWMTKMLSDENVKKEFLIVAKSVDRLRNDSSYIFYLYHELELTKMKTMILVMLHSCI